MLGFCRKKYGGNFATYKGCQLYSELIKNPIGANMAISRFVRSKRERIFLLLGLNDYSVDSTDTSWINYVDFEQLAKELHRIGRIYIYGTAVKDLQKRLVSAGFPEEMLTVLENNEDWDKVFSEKEVFAFMTGSAKEVLVRQIRG